MEARKRPIKSSEEALSSGYTGLISAQQVPYYEIEKISVRNMYFPIVMNDRMLKNGVIYGFAKTLMA